MGGDEAASFLAATGGDEDRIRIGDLEMGAAEVVMVGTRRVGDVDMAARVRGESFFGTNTNGTLRAPLLIGVWGREEELTPTLNTPR